MVCTSFLVSGRIHIEKVHKDLLEHQDLWRKKLLIYGPWKVETCARGSISLCLLIYFLQPSSATWCLEQVNGFCGPVIFTLQTGTSHDMEINDYQGRHRSRSSRVEIVCRVCGFFVSGRHSTLLKKLL